MEEQKRDSFIFYRSFFESISAIEDAEERAKAYDAVCELALNRREIELSGVAKILFPLIKPQIDANYKRYLNGTKPKTKQTKSKKQARTKKSKSGVKADNASDCENSDIADTKDKITRKTLSFGEFKHVKLTQEEYDILSNRVSNINELIGYLDEYLEINPKKKYANHFLMLKNKFPMEEYKKAHPLENVEIQKGTNDPYIQEPCDEEEMEKLLDKYG